MYLLRWKVERFTDVVDRPVISPPFHLNFPTRQKLIWSSHGLPAGGHTCQYLTIVPLPYTLFLNYATSIPVQYACLFSCSFIPSHSSKPALFLTTLNSKMPSFFLHPTPILFCLRFYLIPFHYDCFYFQPKYQ